MQRSSPDSTAQAEILLTESQVFQQFYEQTHLIVFRYLYGLLGGPAQEAEDLAAETFVRAWKTRRRFRGNEKSALGWLMKIARNLAIDASRRRKSRGSSEDLEQHVLYAADASPEQQTQLREQIHVLWGLLQTLPAQQREILTLRYLLGWRVKDIAELLEMPENTVSVNIRRALQHLRESWPMG